VSVAWFFAWRRAGRCPDESGSRTPAKLPPSPTAVIALRGHRNYDRGWSGRRLDWQLYFPPRRHLRIGQRQPSRARWRIFAGPVFWKPSAYQLPYEEGKAWLGWQPALAITGVARRATAGRTEEARIYPRCKRRGRLRRQGARGIAPVRHQSARPDDQLSRGANPGSLKLPMRDLLGRDPVLTQFNPAQKRRLFELWSPRAGFRSTNWSAESRPIRTGSNLPGPEWRATTRAGRICRSLAAR
jgi:hypothetical protein